MELLLLFFLVLARHTSGNIGQNAQWVTGFLIFWNVDVVRGVHTTHIRGMAMVFSFWLHALWATVKRIRGLGASSKRR